MSGYRGRLGIYEMLEMTAPIKEIMTGHDFSLEALRVAARKSGMRTMFEDGLNKVAVGQTTIEEVLRVIRE